MSTFHRNTKQWTETDIRAAAIEAASRLLQGQGLGYVGDAVDSHLFSLAEKIYKYIDTGAKPR